MSEPTIGQIFPRSGGSITTSGVHIEEVAIQPSTPSAHPDLWVDTDDTTGVAGIEEVVIQPGPPALHNDLWIDTDDNPPPKRVIYQVTSSQPMGEVVGTDYVYFATSPITLTLPSAASNTNLYVVKNMIAATGTVTINTLSSQTIDGSLTYLLTTLYQTVRLVSTGSNWITV